MASFGRRNYSLSIIEGIVRFILPLCHLFFYYGQFFNTIAHNLATGLLRGWLLPPLSHLKKKHYSQNCQHRFVTADVSPWIWTFTMAYQYYGPIKIRSLPRLEMNPPNHDSQNIKSWEGGGEKRLLAIAEQTRKHPSSPTIAPIRKFLFRFPFLLKGKKQVRTLFEPFFF